MAYKITHFSQTERQLLACHLMSLCLIILRTCQPLSHCYLYTSLLCVHPSKLQRISKEETRYLYRRYIAFILSSMFLVTFLVISYDLGVNRGAHILPNGGCNNGAYLVLNVITISDSIRSPDRLSYSLHVYVYYKHQLTKMFQVPPS